MRKAAEEGDLYGQVEHDVAFHRLIVEASGNRTLLEVWSSLRAGARTLIMLLKTDVDRRSLAQRHGALLEALRSGDSERAGTAVRDHFGPFPAIFLEEWESEERGA